jgi:pimeloyl-ACP methyl ester carboxylesterase
MSGLRGGRVRSADGTDIGYLELGPVGPGPVLLCTHGAFSSGAEWLPVARLLADRHRVVLMDRRGHGASGDHAGLELDGPEVLEREYADLDAVVAALDGPVTLLGHSIGACIGLLACLRPGPPPFERVVALEPPMVQDLDRADSARFRELLTAGRYEDAVTWGFRDVQGLSEKALDRMRRSPRNWAEIVGAAPLMLRHWEISLEFPDPSAFAGFELPTLLLHGSRSERRPFVHSTLALAAAMPEARLEGIEGHNHVSMSRDPEPVAALIRKFLEEPLSWEAK